MTIAPLRVLSLGWGVQSFGLAAMVALGELAPIDLAIHADTTHERAATYDFARRWTPWLGGHGVKVVTVQPPKAELVLPLRNGHLKVSIPAFTATEKGGQIRRQCTGHWKIEPIRRWLQAHRERRPVELWLGITADEVTRVRPSAVQYITHRWPLLEGERPLRRADISRWLTEHDIEVPGRSACYFCPFQSAKDWRGVQDTPDWDRAVAVDAAIRDVKPPIGLFLHPSMRPLPMIDFRSEQEKGQLELWDNECAGVCGL